ncbi:MAG: protein jag [Oscillospiraceae bacterium]|jgi:spoIIIJ-associated protein|nr:protein jag [Oscillospiraceae bacterium]
MKKTLRKSAKTEDEALRLALDEIGLTRDDVSVEIIERAKSGFLGLGGSPAVVDVNYEADDVIEDAGSAETSGSEKTSEPEKPATVAEPPVSKSPEETGRQGADGREDRLREFLKGLAARLGEDASITISEETEGTLEVSLETGDAGTLIGHRGETLDAIQHLANNVVNKGGGAHLRVNIDVGGYRKRRAEALETLAAKTAAKVVKYRRSVTLEPMNAYERHVIHTALQENDQVSTYSVGVEPRRCVVVAFGNDADNPARRGGRAEERPHHRAAAPKPPPSPSPPPAPVEASEDEKGADYHEWK